jgi:hypothetical protein
VPKPHIFRFENFWLEHPDFTAILQHVWCLPTQQSNKPKNINAKFKNLSRVLKA